MSKFNVNQAYLGTLWASVPKLGRYAASPGNHHAFALPSQCQFLARFGGDPRFRSVCLSSNSHSHVFIMKNIW
ncbi:hypothetical protein [Eastern grey kangaroopox virus]|uniref:Uncharacterized protein n=1 Tax=Eastern grey kangaroopox virus TaxID=2042482 RepID=A0A2C9DTB5_9POXV|nr:hypothetical protein KM541_gp152 [Eastern grey kangaroopox virus]ATI21248.1 hypothetical protein [Eastern grey kangaroopox virus]AXK50188.1 hypothetical protein EKPV-NSW-ORF167 [Eastern grey kangaroopox virus]